MRTCSVSLNINYAKFLWQYSKGQVSLHFLLLHQLLLHAYFLRYTFSPTLPPKTTPVLYPCWHHYLFFTQANNMGGYLRLLSPLLSTQKLGANAVASSSIIFWPFFPTTEASFQTLVIQWLGYYSLSSPVFLHKIPYLNYTMKTPILLSFLSLPLWHLQEISQQKLAKLWVSQAQKILFVLENNNSNYFKPSLRWVTHTYINAVYSYCYPIPAQHQELAYFLFQTGL